MMETFAGIVIILLLYVDDIVLLARCPSRLDKKLRLLKDFYSTMGMIVDTNFMYDNNKLEEVYSYK